MTGHILSAHITNATWFGRSSALSLSLPRILPYILQPPNSHPYAFQSPQRRCLRHRRKHHRCRSRLSGNQYHLYTVGLPDAAVRESRDRMRALSRTPALTCLRRISLSTSPPPTSRREAPASTYPGPSASSAHMEPSSSCLLANSVSMEVSALSPACYPWPSRCLRAAAGIW